MTGVVEISSPGVSGPQHLLIPDTRPRRHPYATPTDVSLILPPLTLNKPDRYGLGKSNNAQPFGSSGVPSPPRSDCSQNYTSEKRPSVTEDSTVSTAVGRLTPPYLSPGSWSSPATQTVPPHSNMPEQVAYEIPFNSLAVRPHTQHQLPQQQAYYTPPYNGGSGMPAPSSLLGLQMAQAPLYPPLRTASTYQGLPPPPSSGTQEYPAIGYDGNLYSTAAGYPFLPAPSSFPSQQLSYPQAYGQQQMLALQPQQRRPAKPTSVYGPLSREIWERVFEHLSYADRLRFQSVSRFWAGSLKSIDQRIKANPTDAEFADMHSTVLKAENYRRHWAPSLSTESKARCGRPRSNARNPPPRSALAQAQVGQLDAEDDEAADGKGGKRAPPGSVGNLGCYHCFTVRPPEKFCLLSNDSGPIDSSNSSSTGDQHHQAQFPAHSQHPQPLSMAAEPSSTDNNDNKQRPGIRRYCIDCGIKKGYHPSNKYLERKWGIEVWICCGSINEHGVMNCPSCKRGCPLTPVNRSTRRSTSTTTTTTASSAGAGNKRASPAMPPPSVAAGGRPQKQHRATNGGTGGGRHGLLDQPLYQYHWPEVPGGITHYGYPT